MSYHDSMKCIIIGEVGVGKSSILSQIVDGGPPMRTEPTVGIEFGTTTMTVDTQQVHLHIWDTSGSDVYRTIIQTYYKNSIIVFLVYDISHYQSYQKLPEWINHIKTFVGFQCQIVLV